MTDHANREHALLSASGAERWLACTPSARLEETLPESQSEYADEGRLAHELAELKALKQYSLMKPSALKKSLKAIRDKPGYVAEMDACADVYLDYLKKHSCKFSERPYTAVEKRVDYSAFVPEGFGTCDFMMIGDGRLHIVDYKHGKGVPVSAEDNPQMKLYALGAWQEYSLLFDIHSIHITIIQPRLDNITEDVMSVEELLEWGNSIKPIAQKAFAGEGDFVHGEHCRFCRAKAQCRARADGYTALEDFGFLAPPILSNEEIGDILTRGIALAKWVEHLKDYALKTCLSGGSIPGWKVVQGRSNRAFINHDQALTRLKNAGIEEAVLYERRPITLAAVEKLLGKEKFAEMFFDFVETPPGKPTLVDLNDKRDPVGPITAQQDFDPVFGAKDDFGTPDF